MVSLFRLRLPMKKLIPLVTHRTAVHRLYSNAQDVMIKNEVVPHVVSEAPTELMKAVFSSGVSADGGNILTPTQVKDPPEVHYTADSGSFYLLVFTDPDSPSRKRPTYREWHHWLVGNIPGTNVKSGEELSGYISPCPPRGTGVHRYVFLVFKQSGKLSFDEPRLTNARTNSREYFRTQKLADKYKLGRPIAGNLFQAEWDEHVDVVYERLSKL